MCAKGAAGRQSERAIFLPSTRSWSRGGQRGAHRAWVVGGPCEGLAPRTGVGAEDGPLQGPYMGFKRLQMGSHGQGEEGCSLGQGWRVLWDVEGRGWAEGRG